MKFVLLLLASLLLITFVEAGWHHRGCDWGSGDGGGVTTLSQDAKKQNCDALQHCQLDCANVLKYCKPNRDIWRKTKNPKYDTRIKTIEIQKSEKEAYTYTCIDKGFKKNPIKTFNSFLKKLAIDKKVKEELYLEAGYMAKFNQFCEKQKTEKLNLEDRLELFKNGHEEYRSRISKRDIIFEKNPKLEEQFTKNYDIMVKLYSTQGRCKCKNFYYYYNMNGRSLFYTKQKDSMLQICIKKFGKFCGAIDDGPYKLWKSTKATAFLAKKTKYKRRVLKRQSRIHYVENPKVYFSCKKAAKRCSSYDTFYHDFKSSCEIEKNEAACESVKEYATLRAKFCGTVFQDACKEMAPICKKNKQTCKTMRAFGVQKQRQCRNRELKSGKKRSNCYVHAAVANKYCNYNSHRQCSGYNDSLREAAGRPIPKVRLFYRKYRHFKSGHAQYVSTGEENSEKCRIIKDESSCDKKPYYDKLIIEYAGFTKQYYDEWVEERRKRTCNVYKSRLKTFSERLKKAEKKCKKECKKKNKRLVGAALTGKMKKYRSYDCENTKKFGRYFKIYESRAKQYCDKKAYHEKLAEDAGKRKVYEIKRKESQEKLKVQYKAYKENKDKTTYTSSQKLKFWRFQCKEIHNHNMKVRKEIAVISRHIKYLARKLRSNIAKCYGSFKGEKLKKKIEEARLENRKLKAEAHKLIKTYKKNYEGMPRKPDHFNKKKHRKYTLVKQKYRACIRFGYVTRRGRRSYTCRGYGYRYRMVRKYSDGTTKSTITRRRFISRRRSRRRRKYTRRYRGNRGCRMVVRRRGRRYVRYCRPRHNPVRRVCSRYRFTKSRCGRYLKKTCSRWVYKKRVSRHIKRLRRKKCLQLARNCTSYHKITHKYIRYCRKFTKLSRKSRRFAKSKRNACTNARRFAAQKRHHCSYYSKVCKRFF